MQNFPAKPFRLSLDLDQRVEHLFRELIHKPWGSDLGVDLWRPAVDFYETNSAYLLEADLPGVDPKNVEVQIDGQRLILKGRRDSTRVSQMSLTVSVERVHGQFLRQFELAHPVDASQIESQIENGILRVKVPKKKQPSE